MNQLFGRMTAFWFLLASLIGLQCPANPPLFELQNSGQTELIIDRVPVTVKAQVEPSSYDGGVILRDLTVTVEDRTCYISHARSYQADGQTVQICQALGFKNRFSYIEHPEGPRWWLRRPQFLFDERCEPASTQLVRHLHCTDGDDGAF